ncbi:hypothetical protein GCM10011380_25010 [Sphingomonas metalli]|uniref:Antibiotic biosynthesis monooxygenase n=1 Tax=Sphingomonas metalli TaxID=1779358 RepID=A0A916T8T9_9SPHN|nr:hypothetical protein [Sphingomonas metalli]GGB34548.1 hypothetical protein GCM10011380_25010 [Sphingomonas metalli]
MQPAPKIATLVTTRIVPARMLPEFRVWADAFDDAAARAAGHVSSLRLEQAGGLFHLIHQFGSSGDRDRWLEASDYHHLLRRAERFPVERRQCVDGRRAHLVVPSESAADPKRTFITTWLAVFPVLLVLSTLVRSVASSLPQPIQLLFSSLMLSALLQFVILPRVQRFARPWTLSDPDGKARSRPA